VLRLKCKLKDEVLESVNAQFADILTNGKIIQRESLPEERDEPDLADLPRLALHFNRKSLGRLRQLIDYLNQTADPDDSD